MRFNKNNAILLALALCGVLAYVLNSQSYFGNDATSITEVNRGLKSKKKKKKAKPSTEQAKSNGGPNVIYLQHESLSGSILLHTEKGKTSSPFFHDRMANDPDFYVFEHHRTGSGNTIDALPSLMTGCLPYERKGMTYAHAKGQSIGYEFAKNGYSTASFSSRALDKDMMEGNWRMLYDMLTGGMDKVEDAYNNHRLKINNTQGSSDDQMLPLFDEWLAELEKETEEGAAKKPFYAQFYNFNQHFPFLDPAVEKLRFFSEIEAVAYYNSINATDKFLESLFDILSRTGQLENTIIVGSGDHGEEPFKSRYVRLGALNSHILHPAAYIYYPRNLMAHEGVAERLRRNTQKMTYTLDMHPTVRSILHSVDDNYKDTNPMSKPKTADAKGCIAGVDLTSVDIPDDRVVLATNLASSQIISTKKTLKLFALMTKDVALYHRQHIRGMHELGQGRDNEYVLQFGSCTQSTTSLCMADFNHRDDDTKEYFRRAVVSLRDTSISFFGGGVKWSRPVMFFVDKLGGESAIEATKNAMKIEHNIAIAADKAIATTIDGDVTEPLPDHSSEGSFFDLIQSVQEKLSWWKDDTPFCDGIFLYMPDMTASIEDQLNNYILASMMATFMNLSMVIMDAPPDSNIKSSSPLGCPRFRHKIMPPVLSSLLKSPEWLSRNCPVPCKKNHGYSDWNALRQSSTNDIPETVCESGNGRQSHVFVMGGGETRKYFEKYFKDPMLQRPSPVAHDWALRLGAKPEEANIFSQLSGEQIWDYLGALVARSDLLRFQNWILDDVANYIAPSYLPAAPKDIRRGAYKKNAWRFDAIQVPRGDELLSGSKTKHIPLDHYLSHFKCSGESPRTVFIATSDREKVTKEITTLGQKHGKGQYKIGCNTFRFRFYLPGTHKTDTSCAAMYSRTVADISRFLIFSNVGSLVGDFDSDWGRLVRTFRLKLTSGATYDGDKSPVSLTGTTVVSATMPPAKAPGL